MTFLTLKGMVLILGKILLKKVHDSKDQFERLTKLTKILNFVSANSRKKIVGNK